MSRPGLQFVQVVLLLALTPAQGLSQNQGSDGRAAPVRPEPAVVTGVRVVHDRGVPTVEVVSTHSIVPTIQSLDSPPRLVIDLPNARSGLERKRISVLQENILTIRTEQYQRNPPVMRIVLDLLVPYGYSWDAVENRLLVRLKPPEGTNVTDKTLPAQPPKVLSLAPVASVAAIPVTSGVGEVVLAGSRFAAGSSLTAGSETAVLQLSRGGEVRICPGTTLSVTPSRNATDLMLGLSTGALETNYALNAGADTVLTPDFRILFAGPGEFHYAVSTDSHGNTCVRSLRGNVSPATVSELIGDRVYQVKPTEQAMFHSGQIDKVDADVPLDCGCPPPVPVIRTENTPAKIIPDSESPANMSLAQNSSRQSSAKLADDALGGGQQIEGRQTLSSGPEIQPLPEAQANQFHVQVDAPLVFHAKKSSATAAADEAASLPVMESSARISPLEPQAQPPAAPAESTPQQHGVFRRIKGFFAAIFR